jgi:predicted HAD superfamily Cof-like phosphohydrolase
LKTELDQVLEFHETFQCFTHYQPVAQIPENQRAVRITLMQEELDEYRAAAEAGDLIGIADALTDLMYVVLGTYLAHGLQDAAEPLFREVHRSNMSKLDEQGQPIFRADGKVLKSVLFTPPELEPVLTRFLPTTGNQDAD